MGTQRQEARGIAVIWCLLRPKVKALHVDQGGGVSLLKRKSDEALRKSLMGADTPYMSKHTSSEGVLAY